jgi:transcriptional regulator with XRE-family HTH domain
MNINVYKIGEQIKKFRELRNYTQDHIAEKLEMTPQGYGKIERNEVEVTIQKLQRIADILGTTIPDMLGFEDKFVFNNYECQQNNLKLGVNHSVNLEEFHKIYEGRIGDLQKEIDRLHILLEKAIS